MSEISINTLKTMLANLDDAKKYQSLRDVMETLPAPDLAAVSGDDRPVCLLEHDPVDHSFLRVIRRDALHGVHAVHGQDRPRGLIAPELLHGVVAAFFTFFHAAPPVFIRMCSFFAFIRGGGRYGRRIRGYSPLPR